MKRIYNTLYSAGLGIAILSIIGFAYTRSFWTIVFAFLGVILAWMMSERASLANEE